MDIADSRLRATSDLVFEGGKAIIWRVIRIKIKYILSTLSCMVTTEQY